MNVANILANMQSGTRLYSALHGKTVELVKVIDGNRRPIKIRQIGDSFSSAYDSFFEDGSFIKGGECMLFPSEYIRVWSYLDDFKGTAEEEAERLISEMSTKKLLWDKEHLRFRKKEQSFKPYDKVLVRDTDLQDWTVDLFGYECSSSAYKYHCVGSAWTQCIPYKGNESLLGKSIKPE